MPSGPEMGGPAFTSRRPNASTLPTFELPPPPLSKSYHYLSGTQSTHTPASLASVGNLLTPNSTLDNDSPSTTAAPAISAYAHSTYPAWSPPTQHQPFYTAAGQAYQRLPSYSPIVRGHPHSPPSSEGSTMPPYDLPPYATNGPLTPASTLPSMSSQHHQNQLMATTPLTNNSANPSPVNPQEAFRPPPTPGYYSGASTPQAAHFPYSTGAPSAQIAPLTAGPLSGRATVSPVTGGAMPPLPMPPSQSPHLYQPSRFPYGPVMSNLHNPNGQALLVGGLTPSLMSGFNSGHAAIMQQSYGPTPSAATPLNERPFKCDQCPQSFNRNHDLKRHKRIHLAVKPFPCGHCDKSFSRKDALKRHILVKGCGKISDVDTPKKDSVAPNGSSVSPKDNKPLKADLNDIKPIS